HKSAPISETHLHDQASLYILPCCYLLTSHIPQRSRVLHPTRHAHNPHSRDQKIHMPYPIGADQWYRRPRPSNPYCFLRAPWHPPCNMLQRSFPSPKLHNQYLSHLRTMSRGCLHCMTTSQESRPLLPSRHISVYSHRSFQWHHVRSR